MPKIKSSKKFNKVVTNRILCNSCNRSLTRTHYYGYGHSKGLCTTKDLYKTNIGIESNQTDSGKKESLMSENKGCDNHNMSNNDFSNLVDERSEYSNSSDESFSSSGDDQDSELSEEDSDGELGIIEEVCLKCFLFFLFD